jgi:hypothetical protein
MHILFPLDANAIEGSQERYSTEALEISCVNTKPSYAGVRKKAAPEAMQQKGIGLLGLALIECRTGQVQASAGEESEGL